jgi:N-methylhydantoinase A
LRAKLWPEFAALEQEGRKQMRAEGFLGNAVRIDRGLDMRYSGQSYELTVPLVGDIIAAFHRAHEGRYGYSDRTRTCEVVNIRARFTGRTPKPRLPQVSRGGIRADGATVSNSKVMFARRRFVATTYDRIKLKAGNRITGPAIVTEYSATTFIPPGWSGHVDLHRNILLEPAR